MKKLKEYADFTTLPYNLKKIIEENNECKLNYSDSFNSFWLNDYNGNELRILFLENIQLTVSRVSFQNKRKGTMTKILKELIVFCQKNNINKIIIQSVLTLEMANFCLKNNFKKTDYMFLIESETNPENKFYSGDYLLEIE